MYLKEDTASKRGKYEHPPAAYPGYPPAAAPGAAPYYPPAGAAAAPAAAAAAANRQYVSGRIVCCFAACMPDEAPIRVPACASSVTFAAAMQ